jgi:hypothetical protein
MISYLHSADKKDTFLNLSARPDQYLCLFVGVHNRSWCCGLMILWMCLGVVD